MITRIVECENSTFLLQIEKLTAKDSHAFNAFIKAVSCSNFLVFIQNYSELFSDLFDCVKIQNKEEKELYFLSKYYTKLSILDLKEIYDAVLEFRNEEFASFMVGNSKNFEELTEYEKTFYKLLFAHGDKIGGYTALATMSPVELINLTKYFVELQNEKIKQIENLKK